jgi:hypothetical protein
MPATAHAGHWLVSLGMAVPAAALAGWVLIAMLRDRRRKRRAR